MAELPFETVSPERALKNVNIQILRGGLVIAS
jgi:hypothetical protein